MLFSEENYSYMFKSLQEAEAAMEENEVPVGAVVVYKNRIIGRGHNQTGGLKDPTAHAEMIAISAAADYLKSGKLNECDLYVTLEPCAMCAGAAILARIKNLYFSAFDPKFGACGSLYNLPEQGKYNHKIKIFSGIYEKESLDLLKNYFKKRRSNN